MRRSARAIAAIFATFTQASAQTPTEMLEHIDDLGRRNEKLQERVRILENDNKALRERLRELGVAAPTPGVLAPQSLPVPGRPDAGEQGPAARTLPFPSAGPPLAGTIDLASDPRGAQAPTSPASGSQTPSPTETSAD